MKRMPKFTSRMFKPKMKRFGAAAPKMPRMPRIKKFQSGGDVEDEVIVSPEQGRKEYAKEFAERESKLKQRDEESKNLVKRYLSERKKADAAEAAKKAEKDSLKKKFDEYMEDLKRQEAEADWNFMQQRKQGVRTARKGGVMRSSYRGDGVAKKGKTRGKFV
jgi:Skp family chaperone for outer membrane proteins